MLAILSFDERVFYSAAFVAGMIGGMAAALLFGV
jgi:hypothetical protein